MALIAEPMICDVSSTITATKEERHGSLAAITGKIIIYSLTIWTIDWGNSKSYSPKDYCHCMWLG